MFPDGLSQYNYPNGNVTLRLPNGTKEYYTAEFKVHIKKFVCMQLVHQYCVHVLTSQIGQCVSVTCI